MKLVLTRFPAVFTLLVVLGRPIASPADEIPGPIEATVIRIVDGDTFVAQAHIWPGQSVTVSVRIRGIDTPELRSRCAAEKAAAKRARSALAGLLAPGTVLISRVSGGKYYGRVLADVTTREGVEVAPVLLRRRLARAYSGGRRVRYCG